MLDKPCKTENRWFLYWNRQRLFYRNAAQSTTNIFRFGGTKAAHLFAVHGNGNTTSIYHIRQRYKIELRLLFYFLFKLIKLLKGCRSALHHELILQCHLKWILVVDCKQGINLSYFVIAEEVYIVYWWAFRMFSLWIRLHYWCIIFR